MIAQTLKEAMNNLDPDHSLQTREELENWFVERSMSPLEDLRLLFEDSNKPQKVLFTGHRGSGKSTELAKLALELHDQFFFTVNYSIKSILNLYDLTYVDVVLSLGLELFRKATQQNMNVNPKVLENIAAFTRELTTEIQVADSIRADVGAEINFLVTKLSAKLGTEDQTRTIVREKISRRISDLLENIDFLAREIERTTHRRTLMIVEDLDKTDLKVTQDLFCDHATSLVAPPVSIIYTFPVALRHDNAFMQVRQNFTNFHVLPNMKVRFRNETQNPEGIETLKNMLTKRVRKELFTDEALTRLPELSSGLPREMMTLARNACLESRKAKKSVIDLVSVEKAERTKRREYQVLLSTAQLRLLAAVKKKKLIENDEDHQKLLHSLSALEYRNDDVWYDVHAVVEPLLPSE